MSTAATSGTLRRGHGAHRIRTAGDDHAPNRRAALRPAKRDAFAAHRSQIGGGLSARLFGLVMLLPPQLFGLVLSHEWFVDPAAQPGTMRRSIFDVPARGD